MAMRGDLIGHGYVKGTGAVLIYSDMDNKDFLFVVTKAQGIQKYVMRAKVQFRPWPKTKTK